MILCLTLFLQGRKRGLVNNTYLSPALLRLGPGSLEAAESSETFWQRKKGTKTSNERQMLEAFG